jgi:hypothetical protein
MAFLGPRDGMAISERTPSGMEARSSSRAWIAPVSRYSSTFSAMAFPTLGMACRALRSRPAMSPWKPPMERAAFSYARVLNGSPPEMEMRSAYSFRSSSTSSFSRAMGTV